MAQTKNNCSLFLLARAVFFVAAISATIVTGLVSPQAGLHQLFPKGRIDFRA